MSYLKKINDNYYIYAILIFVFIPINFIPQLWDAVVFIYGFEIRDITGIENHFKEGSRYIHLLSIYLVYFLTKLTSLPADIFIDNLIIIFLILFCLEVKKISKILFGLENKWCNLAALFTAIFPAWHVLVAFNIGQHLVSFYFLLFGYRNFISKKKINIFVGLFFIFLSFNTESALSFAVGLIVVSLLSKKVNNKHDFSVSIFKLIIIILSCLVYYFIIRGLFFPPFGYRAYMAVSWSNLFNLTETRLIENVLNYLTYVFLFLWIPVIFFIHILFLNKNHFSKIKLNFKYNNNYFLLIILFVFAIFPYLILNKSSSILYLSDYYQRHAFLLAPISGMFFSIMFRDMAKINCLQNKVNLNFYLTIFVCINLVLLNYGNYRKIESHLFRTNLSQELMAYGSIPKGNVLFIGKNVPADLRTQELNYLLYKAYNIAGWWSTPIGAKEPAKPPSNYINNELYKKEYIFTEYKYECDIYIYLKNDLKKFDRMKKFYIFNYKKYYNIDKIVKKC